MSGVNVLMILGAIVVGAWWERLCQSPPNVSSWKCWIYLNCVRSREYFFWFILILRFQMFLSSVLVAFTLFNANPSCQFNMQSWQIIIAHKARWTDGYHYKDIHSIHLLTYLITPSNLMLRGWTLQNEYLASKPATVILQLGFCSRDCEIFSQESFFFLLFQ